jgi:hypothetical protein
MSWHCSCRMWSSIEASNAKKVRPLLSAGLRLGMNSCCQQCILYAAIERSPLLRLHWALYSMACTRRPGLESTRTPSVLASRALRVRLTDVRGMPGADSTSFGAAYLLRRLLQCCGQYTWVLHRARATICTGFYHSTSTTLITDISTTSHLNRLIYGLSCSSVSALFTLSLE